MAAPPDPPGERSGVLVVRAWVETSDGQLRACVIRSTSWGRPEVSTPVGSAEEVLAYVDDWLRDLLGSDG